MKLLALAAGIALVMLGGVGVANAGFSALALGYDGVYGWATGYPDMEMARAAARDVCRVHGGGSCTETVAEDDAWYFSGAYCNGEPYVGASGVSGERALGIALVKGFADGRTECTSVDGMTEVNLAPNQLQLETPSGGLLINW